MEGRDEQKWTEEVEFQSLPMETYEDEDEGDMITHTWQGEGDHVIDQSLSHHSLDEITDTGDAIIVRKGYGKAGFARDNEAQEKKRLSGNGTKKSGMGKPLQKKSEAELAEQALSLDTASKTALPLTAISYFLVKPKLWALGCAFVCLSTILFIVTIILLFLTFPWQMDFLQYLFGVGHNSNWFVILLLGITVFFMILVEVLILFVAIFFGILKPFLMDFILVIVFADKKILWTPYPRHCCTNVLRLLLFTLMITFVMIITFPLNFIPLIGPVLWCLANGFFVAWDVMDAYFDHHKLTFRETFSFCWARALPFTLFGSVALALTMIPFLGILFLYTDFVAASLWAAEIEASHIMDQFKVLDEEDQQELEKERSRQINIV